MTNPDLSGQPDGATPIDDASGLKQSHIYTLAQLNEAEALNILAAVDWIERGRVGSVFQLAFYLELHKRMLQDVWDWAGHYRLTKLNIGVPYYDVPMRLQQAGLDFQTQHEANAVSFLEFMATYHHRLVWIHPFRNGNGRWARLACDAVAIRVLKQPPIVWASSDLATASQERSRYIEALRAADGLDHRPLVRYLSEHNPDRD